MHALPLPPGPFDLIPPTPGWPFTTWSSKGRKKCPKYRTESVEQSALCRSRTDCRQAMPTAPVGPRGAAASRIRSARGVGLHVPFAAGLGERGCAWYWLVVPWRARERALIGGRGGRICPVSGARPLSWFAAPKVRRNSRKPEALHVLIEQIWPDARRVELFARPPHRPGWTVWGDEA